MREILLTAKKSDQNSMEGVEVVKWLEYLEVALIASVKFLIAPFDAERNHFNWIESFAVTTTGGIAGIFVFVFVGENISAWWRHFMALVKSVFLRRPAEVIERKPRKKFTRKNRLIVWIKMKFGLAGIAFITPCIISIPIGTVVAISFYKKRGRVLLYLLISLILWSLVLNALAQILKLSQYIPHSH